MYLIFIVDTPNQGGSIVVILRTYTRALTSENECRQCVKRATDY
jgi:hypothetical protein